MQISIKNPLGTKRYHSQTDKSDQEASQLSKLEIVHDIFNNRQKNQDKKGDTKLRLSQTSKVLQKELLLKIKDFLDAQPEIAKELNRINLPDSDFSHYSKNTEYTIRKLNMYLHWLAIKKENQNISLENDEDQAFQAIQKFNKDDEIIALYQANEEKRIDIINERQRSAPNYYYIVFPETYSFN